jgi:SepF-like predicted cell division protein (DUF552 family)
MKKFFSNIRDKFASGNEEKEEMEFETGYVELDGEPLEKEKKVVVRPFILKEFEDIKLIIDELRNSNTICLINIKSLKEKDIVELKRAINKLKKTCDAHEGEIAGFGEDWIVVTPSFATIYKSKANSEKII